MTENPHDTEEREEEHPEKREKPERDGAWSEDQKRRGYYYDDAHGYEIYRDEEEEVEEK